MDFFSIASGSSGNCICAGNEDTHVLIDVGISGKRVELGLNFYDYSTTDISAIFITHEHSDHVAGLGVISRKYHIPIYASKGTITAVMKMSTLGKIDDTLFHVVESDQIVNVGSLNILPFNVSHDAAQPLAYRIDDAKASVAVCTDLGYYDEYIVEKLQNLNVLLLEANHDIHMLEVGSYPFYLKQRILSKMGHLSNESSGQLLCRVLHDDLKHIFLGHLSKENNYPQLAYETVKLELTMNEAIPYSGDDFNITVANRDGVSERIVV